jgi:hypothetical protein
MHHNKSMHAMMNGHHVGRLLHIFTVHSTPIFSRKGPTSCLHTFAKSRMMIMMMMMMLLRALHRQAHPASSPSIHDKCADHDAPTVGATPRISNLERHRMRV